MGQRDCRWVKWWACSEEVIVEGVMLKRSEKEEREKKRGEEERCKEQ